MSDFLSNLIARSFTDAPVIRPRVPSLFETSTKEFVDELQLSQEVIAEPGQVAPRSASVPASESSPTKEPDAMTPIANVSAARAGERMPTPDAPVDQRALTIKSRERSVQASGVRKLEVETKRISFAEDSFGNGKEDAREQDRVFEASSPPRAVQSPRRRNLSPAEGESSTSGPIIRVTIGRIEVRAIHQPAAAPKSAKAAPPKLSLDEYLKGGKR